MFKPEGENLVTFKGDLVLDAISLYHRPAIGGSLLSVE